MTLEELKAIPLQYNFGYAAEDHGLRQYVNEEHGIAKPPLAVLRLSSYKS